MDFREESNESTFLTSHLGSFHAYSLKMWVSHGKKLKLYGEELLNYGIINLRKKLPVWVVARTGDKNTSLKLGNRCFITYTGYTHKKFCFLFFLVFNYFNTIEICKCLNRFPDCMYVDSCPSS